MKRLSQMMLMILVVVATGCGSQQMKEEVKKIGMANPPKHVIYIGYDGLSSYSLNNGGDMPTVRKMMAEGASTLQKRTVLPSSSAVNWASMFMGAGPELHGYTEWGSKTPELPSRVVNKNGIFPTIFSELREAMPEAEIGVAYEWDGIRYLVDTLALSTIIKLSPSIDDIEASVAPATEYIKSKKPTLFAFVIDQPDGVGHGKGWESDDYMEALPYLDRAVAAIIKAVEDAGMMDETIFIFTSDHGGVETGHGAKSMKEMETPLIFWGKGIKRGHQITESTVMYDVASTMAYMFGIEQPQVWTGRPVVSIFE